jgi:hypothetical protein
MAIVRQPAPTRPRNRRSRWSEAEPHWYSSRRSLCALVSARLPQTAMIRRWPPPASSTGTPRPSRPESSSGQSSPQGMPSGCTTASPATPLSSWSRATGTRPARSADAWMTPYSGRCSSSPAPPVQARPPSSRHLPASCGTAASPLTPTCSLIPRAYSTAASRSSGPDSLTRGSPSPTASPTQGCPRYCSAPSYPTIYGAPRRVGRAETSRCPCMSRCQAGDSTVSSRVIVSATPCCMSSFSCATGNLASVPAAASSPGSPEDRMTCA